MSVAKDAVSDAVKLMLTEMLNEEHSEVRDLLKQAIFKMVAEDPGVRNEISTLVDMANSPVLQETQRVAGLLKQHGEEIQSVRRVIKVMREPWWKKVLRFRLWSST